MYINKNRLISFLVKYVWGTLDIYFLIIYICLYRQSNFYDRLRNGKFTAADIFYFYRFSIEDLSSEQKFLVNLNLQICFESTKECMVDIPVFTHTKLPKKLCDWTTDFLDESVFCYQVQIWNITFKFSQFKIEYKKSHRKKSWLFHFRIFV